MKKITSLFIVAVMLLSLWSCTAEPTPAASADSSSGEFVLTKDMISDMLSKAKDEATSPEGNLPEFMSMEKVKAYVDKSDFAFKELLREYEFKVFENFETLISKLPERCVIYQSPTWISSSSAEVSKYVVLDPKNVPEDTTELGLYLEWKYYETRYAEYDRDYSKYYDLDMNALDEKYSNVGTVLVERKGGTWFYLDPAEDTLEIIDFFPDHDAIKRESLRPIKEQVEEFTAMVNEITENRKKQEAQ